MSSRAVPAQPESGDETDRAAECRRSVQERQPWEPTGFGEFERSFDFALDAFQVEACRALESGSGVLVAAPTGAGKTIAGEFAVFLALRRGLKAFYTTPIKALSNQKYAELIARYGADRVGLLTGDTSVNPEAQVVVMTTEVLLNMLYAGSSSLANLGFVVMDEVHYLADRFRGAVWEEVIIHLPLDVQLISLSATVSNAEEFGAWLDTVRGQTTVVVCEHRPVPLWQHVMVGQDLIDLFAGEASLASDGLPTQPAGTGAGGTRGAQGFSADRGGSQIEDQRRGTNKGIRRAAALDQVPLVNEELVQLARSEAQLRTSRYARGRAYRRQSHVRGGPRGPFSGAGDGAGLSPRRPSRSEAIMILDRAGLLPAITFIFSRAGCDAAVQQCVDAGLLLTTEADRRQIESRIDALSQELPSEDLDVLGFWSWREGLLRGVAAHHAGMLPTFKETVEALFAEGLVRAVFATETLALGVNMPAKSVVLEKFNGESLVSVTAGEYTQLTGRAGRRGIDVEGHAVVLWQPGMDPMAVAGLASRRTYPLNSSFRPTYNMSINLIAQFGRPRAREILESSFAQFQADRSVVGLARQVRSSEEAMLGYAKAMTCHLGDFTEYASMRRELTDLETSAARQASRTRRAALDESLAALRVGDVIEVATRSPYHAVVVTVDSQARDGRPTVLTTERELHRLSWQDLAEPVEPVQRLRVPRNFNLRSVPSRNMLVSQLRNAVKGLSADGGLHRPDHGGAVGRRLGVPRETGLEEQVATLRCRLRAHPCHGCADREAHARWSERWWRLRKETDGLVRQIDNRTGTIAKTFDRVCELLLVRDFVQRDDHGQLHPTEEGQRLRRIYGEKDLLIALVLREGAFDRLGPEELAAFASTLVYQAKREERGLSPKMPTAALDDATDLLIRQWSELEDDEEQARLPLTAEPDFGMAWPLYSWARGRRLEKVLEGTDFAAGDFVRWAKQVIDLLNQMAQVPGAEVPASHTATSQSLRKRCREAIALIRRDVVAYSAL